MAEDIAPQLIEDVTAEFHKLYNSSDTVQALLKKVQQGTATFAEAQAYSLEVSRLIGRAYAAHVSSAALPNGKMYYNIASRLIPSTLDENYKLVSDYSVRVQQALNADAGIGLKAQAAEQNRDRVDGLVDMVSNADQYDDVSGKLLSAVENYSQNVVDETIKANAGFHYRAGLRSKIIRKAERKCCAWCSGLAGEYDYPNVPDDIYRRHENCRCTVLYNPADGSKDLQNVHTKQWKSAEEYDKIKNRKSIGLLSDNKRRYELDIVIGKSLGAKAKNYIVLDLETGDFFRFAEGSRIQNVEVFAGKGTKNVFRKAPKYADRYGGSPEDWQHAKGHGVIETPDGDRAAEVHWVQCDGVGKFDFFVKKWED